ncbi:MAG: transglycosylase SLT domain-containing protein [Alphaproteobacteria bacterium]|nr:transglycosylase SLT domain-containing protein [Alphaproteobacteria bacterium]
MLSFFWMVGRPLLIFCIVIEVGYCAIDLSFNSCAVHVAQYEKQHKIPTGLLHAISKAESGRKDDTGHIVAWPWTVNAEGQGYYFATKEEAIRAVKNMQQKGIQSIDVGCMQINLYYHPNAFTTLSDAFDPVQNVAYAARFLTGLKNEHASWHTAVAHYHSANPVHHIPYRENVLNIWDRDIKDGGISLAAGVFETTRFTRSFPQASRIRRLMPMKTLKLKGSQVIFNASHGGAVRKVTRHSSHIRRANMIKKSPS